MNILSKYQFSDVISDPFPHIILEEVFPEDYYSKLSSNYPDKPILKKNKTNILPNQRIQISSVDIEKDPSLDDSWRECYENNTNEEFYDDFLRLFQGFLEKYYGRTNKERLVNYKSLGRRGVSENDINLDFQPGLNTPPQKFLSKTVRGPHIDNPKEIYAGLVYFRSTKDFSSGGDLEVCSLRKEMEIYGKMEIPRSKVKVEKTLKYKGNSGIFFLNTPFSIHSVTNRTYTKESRKLLNIIGEANSPLFQINRSKSFSSKLKRKFYQAQASLGYNL